MYKRYIIIYVIYKKANFRAWKRALHSSYRAICVSFSTRGVGAAKKIGRLVPSYLPAGILVEAKKALGGQTFSVMCAAAVN